ncbi:MAG: hypothetical protein KGO81_01540 [Bacteroidota bacterium]|nr:hypothetical protein [Bacteroidota bacterium]
MKFKSKSHGVCILLCICSHLFAITSFSQTTDDAIMMGKNNLCSGLMYSHSSWDHYWEGTFKRDNQNLGTVSTQMLAVMGNYGVSSKLNILFGLPYVQTQASAGTLHGMKGVQDLSLWVKWMPVEKDLGKGTFSLYLLGGASAPTHNYVVDYLPLSIGLKSKTLSAKLMLDYQLNNFFVTGSETYTYRSNITIDRSSYYDNTDLILSNEVQMPDVNTIQLRTGYRSDRLIAEALITDMKTLGGFDIRKNDMPFPSNQMNITTIGTNFKYEIQKVLGLSLTGGANYVIAGRNVGQATGFNIGVFYILDFTHHKKESDSDSKK